jgi:hypothetical protein
MANIALNDATILPHYANPDWMEFSERTSSPSIVPGFNADVYLVLDDFGQLGRATERLMKTRPTARQ